MATGTTRRERAPGLRPGPDGRLGAVGLSGVALRTGLWYGAPPSAREPRPGRLRLRLGVRLGRRHLGGRPAVGRLPCLRVAGEARRLLVPVGLAHPAEPVLLAGLRREVLDRRLVRVDPEPRRADAAANGCCLVGHDGVSLARRRPSGVAADVHHSAGAVMQGLCEFWCYRSGRSPGYGLRIRSSSAGVRPRPSSRRERSSAPSMNAWRSLRFNAARRMRSASSSRSIAATVADR